jgi:hypothetical protein
LLNPLNYLQYHKRRIVLELMILQGRPYLLLNRPRISCAEQDLLSFWQRYLAQGLPPWLWPPGGCGLLPREDACGTAPGIVGMNTIISFFLWRLITSEIFCLLATGNLQ